MSFFRYPGGKSKLKKKIVRALVELAESKLNEYREPFFGGGSVGLDLIDKVSFSSLWINDKDYGVWCIWKSVCDYPDDFQAAINGFESEKYFTQKKAYRFFEELKESVKTVEESEEKDKVVKCALNKLLVHQTSYSGLGTMAGGPIGGKDQDSDYPIGCRWNPKTICNKIQKINVKVKNKIICTHGGFEEVLNNGMALIYLDPPYYEKGNELYQCAFKTKDHETLMKCLRESNHEWVLSYDDCDDVRKLYDWAHIESFEAKYTINASTKVKDKDGKDKIEANKKTELLIFPAKYKDKQFII